MNYMEYINSILKIDTIFFSSLFMTVIILVAIDTLNNRATKELKYVGEVVLASAIALITTSIFFYYEMGFQPFISISLGIMVYFLLVSSYTDMCARMVNRYSLRAGYILNGIYVVLTMSTMYSTAVLQDKLLNLFLIYAVLTISFFFATSVGASDCRILFVVLPVMYFMFNNLIITLVAYLLVLVIVEIRQKIIQHRAKYKVSLPIAPLLIILSMISCFVPVVFPAIREIGELSI